MSKTCQNHPRPCIQGLNRAKSSFLALLALLEHSITEISTYFTSFHYFSLVAYGANQVKSCLKSVISALLALSEHSISENSTYFTSFHYFHLLVCGSTQAKSCLKMRNRYQSESTKRNGYIDRRLHFWQF